MNTKMKMRILSLLLCFVMLVGLMPATAVAGEITPFDNQLGADGDTTFSYSADDTANSTLSTAAYSAGQQQAAAVVSAETHHVTFNLNGGTMAETNPVEVTHGEKATKPAADPTYAGRVFAGWYSDAGLTTPFDFENTEITADTTVYAKWDIVITAASATVTVPVGGEHPDRNPVSGDSSRYTVRFEMWYLHVHEDLYPSLDAGSVYEAGKNYSLRVIFTPKPGYQFTEDTTFWVNGKRTTKCGETGYREYSVTALDSATKISVLSATIAAPVDGEHPSYTAIPGDGTKYTAEVFAWHGPNGALSASDTFVAGKQYAVRIQFAAKDGYDIVDSATYTINGAPSYIAYQAGQREMSFTATCHVVFHLNGGTMTGQNSVEVAHGEKVAKPAADPTYAGRVFAGWYSDAGLTTPFDFENTEITASTTIYAKWNIIITAVSAAIPAPVGGEHPSFTATAGDDAKYTAEVVAWYGPNSALSASDTFAAGKEYTVRIHFTAKPGYEIADLAAYTINDTPNYTTFETVQQRGMDFKAACHVRFHLNGGTMTGANSVEVAHGEKATKPAADPKYADHVFAGWYSDAGLTTPFDFENTVITADTTIIYAKWDIAITAASATITVPVGGEHPDRNPVSGDSSRYTVRFETWYLRETGYPPLNADDVYEAGKYYSLRVIFTPKPGYQFTEDATFLVNGKKTTKCGGIGYREYSVTALASATQISVLSATIAAPIAGEHPSFTATAGDGTKYTAEVDTWDGALSASDTFVAGKQYTVRIQFTAKDGYEIVNSATYIINGEPSDISYLNKPEQRGMNFVATVPVVWNGDQCTVTLDALNDSVTICAASYSGGRMEKLVLFDKDTMSAVLTGDTVKVFYVTEGFAPVHKYTRSTKP